MKNVKDLINILLYFYALKLVLINSSIIAFVVVIFYSIIFAIKYFRLLQVTENKQKKSKILIKKILQKQRKYFIETLVHDLKIPTLAQLRGLDVLNNGILGELNSEQKDLIYEIENSCKYVLDMISMLSNAYLLETNSYKPKYQKFCLSELVFSCFEELKNAASEKRITFVYLRDEMNTVIEADKNCIKKVIMNLLMNAINYSETDKKINVKIEAVNNMLKLTINNTVYTNINQLKYSTIGEKIGIYLCKKIIEFHKGRIYGEKEENLSDSLSFVIPKTALQPQLS